MSDFRVTFALDKNGNTLYSTAAKSPNDTKEIMYIQDNLNKYSVTGNAYMFIVQSIDDPAKKMNNILVFNN